MDAATLITRLEEFYINFGYPFIFISAFVEISPFGWLIPGGTIIAGGGFYSYGGTISLFWVIVWGWLGAWLTLILSYILGRKSGLYFAKKLKQEKNVKKAEILLKTHGPSILTTSLLANVTRFWTAYVAGVEKYNFLKFLGYSGVASLAWTSLMATVGYLAGSERVNLETSLVRLGIAGWILAAVAIFVIYWNSRREFKHFKGENRKP